jgi:hypothetical protein
MVDEFPSLLELVKGSRMNMAGKLILGLAPLTGGTREFTASHTRGEAKQRR